MTENTTMHGKVRVVRRLRGARASQSHLADAVQPRGPGKHLSRVGNFCGWAAEEVGISASAPFRLCRSECGRMAHINDAFDTLECQSGLDLDQETVTDEHTPVNARVCVNRRVRFTRPAAGAGGSRAAESEGEAGEGEQKIGVEAAPDQRPEREPQVPERDVPGEAREPLAVRGRKRVTRRVAQDVRRVDEDVVRVPERARDARGHGGPRRGRRREFGAGERVAQHLDLCGNQNVQDTFNMVQCERIRRGGSARPRDLVQR